MKKKREIHKGLFVRMSVRLVMYFLTLLDGLTNDIILPEGGHSDFHDVT